MRPITIHSRYDRCPASNECAAIELGSRSQTQRSGRAEPSTPARCCKNLDVGMQCQPACQRFIQNDETALSSETGFYWKFESDPNTGRPFGCPGFNEKWLSALR